MSVVKVKNLAKKGFEFLGWRVLPDGRVKNLSTKVVQEGLPDTVAYSPQAKKLADRGLLEIPGYVKAAKAPIVTPPLASTGVELEEPEVVTSAKEEKPDEKREKSKGSGGKKKKARKGGWD